MEENVLPVLACDKSIPFVDKELFNLALQVLLLSVMTYAFGNKCQRAGPAPAIPYPESATLLWADRRIYGQANCPCSMRVISPRRRWQKLLGKMESHHPGRLHTARRPRCFDGYPGFGIAPSVNLCGGCLSPFPQLFWQSGPHLGFAPTDDRHLRGARQPNSYGCGLLYQSSHIFTCSGNPRRNFARFSGSAFAIIKNSSAPKLSNSLGTRPRLK